MEHQSFPAGFATSKRMRSLILICMALVVMVAAVYMQTAHHEFLNFDDNVYVTGNTHVARGITATNIAWAFTSLEESNWHPLTWLSHMADVQFFGMNPRGHHLTSVIIHAASSLLLFLLLFRMTGATGRSAFVAALFALHPLHVESVAWVAERKDVLSAFFCFLTLWLYAGYAIKRQPAWYLLTLFSFVLGLMSKPMLVTLPLVMFLMDYWPLGRYRSRAPECSGGEISPWALVKEKIPFFACSLASAVVTIIAQHSGGAIKSLGAIPPVLRFENALVAYVTYIGKTFWPRGLAVLYPIPRSFPVWQVVGSLLILLLVSVAVVRARKRHPSLAVGWFWFIITLVPVIGLVQVGIQAMADRYSYIPLTGLFIMLAWGIPDLAKALKWRTDVLALLAGGVVAVSTVLSWQQLGYWRDSGSLYRHALQVTSNNYVIHNNLGNVFAATWNLDAAIREFREALRINPGYAEAHYNLGMACALKGDTDAAIEEFAAALRINPEHPKARHHLGVALERKRWQNGPKMSGNGQP